TKAAPWPALPDTLTLGSPTMAKSPEMATEKPKPLGCSPECGKRTAAAALLATTLAGVTSCVSQTEESATADDTRTGDSSGPANAVEPRQATASNKTTVFR